MSQSIDSRDRGYLYGDGLFETIRVQSGHVRWLDAHLDRLWQSGQILGFSPDLIKEAQATLSSCKDNGVWRVTVSRQSEPALWGGHSSIVCHHRDYIARPSLTLHVAPDTYFPGDTLAQHKTTSYMRSIMAKRLALQLGADDVVRCASTGEIGETSCANIFLHINNEWCTPPVQGLLPGVTRGGVLCLMQQDDTIQIRERPIFVDELRHANEIFVTNAVQGVQVVTMLEQRKLSTSLGLKIAHKVSQL